MRSELDRWLMRHPMPAADAGKEVRRDYFAAMPARVDREWQVRRGKLLSEEPEFNAAIVDRAQRRMARVDSLPAGLRECVYEYGLEIVQEFINHGVKNPASIRHLIGTVRGEPINGQNRFKLNKGPNTKQNAANTAGDDDEYYVVTPAGRHRR